MVTFGIVFYVVVLWTAILTVVANLIHSKNEKLAEQLAMIGWFWIVPPMLTVILIRNYIRGRKN